MTALRDERRTTNSTFDTLREHSSFVTLVLILIAYLSIGALYAVKTPAWQVPDEPAHYNYVRFIAEGRGLPVLQPGDYDQAYLERIKAARFPPAMPIDSIRYESWQPPFYYILAAPIYLASGGSLLALRLFSVALGGLVVCLAFLIVCQLAPNSPALALGSAAFVAFVPQHVAMMAGAQNDSLAELLLALIIWQISNLQLPLSNSKWVTVGVLLGLGLSTKVTVYVAVPLVAAAIWLRTMNHPGSNRAAWILKGGGFAFIPALVMALPWWIRNVVVYGWPDFLASIRHDVVVAGQPTPAEWISKFGLGEYLRQYVVTTFHSFWGQFGWMGVPMNERYYSVLAVFSLAALLGFLWYLARNTRTVLRSLGVWLLASWILFAALDYIGYNVKYVQFQGRYLFPALIPIGLAFTIGLRQWATLLPRGWRNIALAVPFAGLAALCLVALFRMIVPMLSP